MLGGSDQKRQQSGIACFLHLAPTVGVGNASPTLAGLSAFKAIVPGLPEDTPSSCCTLLLSVRPAPLGRCLGTGASSIDRSPAVTTAPGTVGDCHRVETQAAHAPCAWLSFPGYCCVFRSSWMSCGSLLVLLGWPPSCGLWEAQKWSPSLEERFSGAPQVHVPTAVSAV